MSDSPPRDPKIADAAAPNAGASNATGAGGASGANAGGRAPLSSNLQYLMKQPSTPWMTFDRDSKAAAVESSLDAGWGEEGAPEPAPPPRPLPPAPPMPLGEVKFLFDSSAPPADVKAPNAPAEVKVPVDVPPPPAHLMAVVDQVLAQSRPPPADPGPANSPRTNLEWPVSALHASSAVATSPVLDLARRADVAASMNMAPHADVAASAPFAGAPTFETYGAPHGSLETSGELAPAKKSNALLFAALGGGALVVIGIVVVALVALRSPSDKSASSAMTSATNATAFSVAIAPSASAPPDIVTLPAALPTNPKASASVASVDDVPAVAAAAPSTPSIASSAAASATPSPASAIDPKTGAKRASYLTIPRAASRHHVFLDGKLMLGSGARSFPVKCGEHTLAIDDRKATRTINVTCGGEYVVTN